ncbi:oxidoreductase [Aurantiacibacter luteus]|uniref:Oxidoreductase n=1 Tax=Aurantiacibacter luteus TaxID=1581420 RepID=A0A0G9N0Z6_9SPHN|nr:oxidoreductase [Aurantiacibacter luteus]KLE35203.1 oxidoreductase [Aurantiacibacter luteus]
MTPAQSFAFADIPDQTGRTAMVTGANTGIGSEIARHLAMKGARVLLACRERSRAEAAMAKIRSEHASADLDFVPLDLAGLASVAGAVEQAKSEPRLDLLVNNAGVMMPPLSHATAGAELQFAVNHLGHFALTLPLIAKLAEGQAPRVVVQSSIAHRRADIDFDNLDASQGYGRSKFYGQSKLANLLFALELDRRLRAASSPVAAIACHPGVAASELTRHLPGGALLKPLMAFALNTSEQGALPALQAATDPNAEGGDYYGPYGFREISGNTSARAHAMPRAHDEALAARLWTVSEEMTGVTLAV